ncbi:MAG: aldo/keto reductase [Herbinix sp.]|jgi:aryl-alcohol dehydrogenase-like predicted oxidoreductase|nr:aldo/keto reductase [Herbinix sp.]
MEYRSYVEGSPQISVIGFGAWQLGNDIDWHGMSETEAIRLVHKAIDEGVNFFDTAPNYGLGSSETLLGKAMNNIKRETLVINTKYGHHNDGHTDYGHESIRESIEGSLKRLNTNYIDSVLLHNPPSDLLKEDDNAHYEILEQLMKEGKILAYGASLDTKEDMITFMNNTKGKVIEAFFNILHQDVRFAFDLAKKKGVKIIAKIPLDSGWLSGKYHKDSIFEGIRSRWSREDIITRAELVDQIRGLPLEGQSLSQFALQYCLAYDEVSTVIPGVATMDQLLMNIDALKYPMNKEKLQWLETFYEEQVVNKRLVW